MPLKPMRFGIKVWAAEDALSKYLWNFEVYCRKSENPHNEDVNEEGGSAEDRSFEEDGPCSGKGEGLEGHNVVKHLL
jgi:hypothetical protein